MIPVIAKKFGNLTSSGGTSGGTSSGSTTKSCTKAPEIPSLTSSTTSDGIQFSALAKLTGEKATSLFYSYSYFDGIKNAWDAWSSWYTASPSTGVTYKALSGNSKTFVAFAVYASNSCGDSEQARETPSRTGLKLPTQTDTSATGLGNTGRFVSINANLNKIELSSTGSSSSVITVNVTDIVGKPVPNVSFVLQIVGVGAFINLQKSLTDKTNSKGEYLAEVKSSEAGTSTVKVTVTSPGQFNDSFGIVNGVARSGAKAGISSSSLTINFERTSSSLTSLDAAQEAADAANAATDAANAAAEGTAAATTAAQNAADAVAALSSQVSELVASLKKQILSLSALIAKIQTKLNS